MLIRFIVGVLLTSSLVGVQHAHTGATSDFSTAKVEFPEAAPSRNF